jgi:hypothetical protein
MKMESYMNNYRPHSETTTNFGRGAYNQVTKPNPGLDLATLSNIPKDLKLKMNSIAKQGHGSSYVSAGTLLPSKSASKLKIPNMNTSRNSYCQRYKAEGQSNSLNNSKRVQSSSSSNFFKKNVKKVHSPTSNIYKSNRCHRYHTDLDFNYLTNEKFLKDAMSCGKDRLSTVALKSASPDKYFYENKPNTAELNRYNKNVNWVNNVNMNNYISKENEEGQLYNNLPNTCNIGSQISKSNEKINDDEYNLKKSSQGILSDLLDNHFSVNSPSQLKIFQKEIDQLKNEEFKRNILNIKKNEADKDLSISGNNQIKESRDKIYVDDDNNNRLTINLSYVGDYPQEKFVESLENVLLYLDPIFDRLTLSERVEKFIECTDDPKRGVKLGAVVALYIILRKFHIDDEYKLLILEKTLSLLQNYESQEELFLIALLEICSIFAPHELLLDNISLICMFLTDFNFPGLQKAAFNCLMSMEYEGIKTLVELASKDYQEYQKFILTSLLNTPHIQKIIIIRALLNEVYSTHPDKRHSALAALNRMHDLVGDSDALNKLSKFFHEAKIEKIFLSSTIRTSGLNGEKILLNELKNNKDFSVRVAIASVLSYRLPKNPKYLKLRLDNNDTYCLTKNLPGSFCTYYGKVNPYIFEKEDDGSDYLEVNTRDFLASLQRMLVMNYDHSNPQIVNSGYFNILESLDFSSKIKSNPDREILTKYANYFELNNNLKTNTTIKESTVNKSNYNENNNSFVNENMLQDFEEDGRILISEEVIRALSHCLKDYSTAVRDTAAGALGQIGLPESLLSIDQLVDSINDEDVNVKSKVIWAIGRISAGVDNMVIYPVVDALKSNMWKVKSACLYALSQFGYRCSKLALPVLNKLLRESAINKQTIAETMVKLGSDGESTLLRVMGSENDSNYKLKSSIAKAFALSSINSPNIDFIVECLFKVSKSNNPIIRKNALFAIRILAEKSEERVTYLKRKNIIPFYYEMMLDKEVSIQAVKYFLI